MNKKKQITSSLSGALLSILSAIGLISCCGFPLLASSLAIIGIGSSQLAFLNEYQNLFIIFALIALSYTFYILYLKNLFNRSKNNSESMITSCCETNSKSNSSSIIAKVFFWIGLIAICTTLFMNSKSENTKEKQAEEKVESGSCCTQNTH